MSLLTWASACTSAADAARSARYLPRTAPARRRAAPPSARARRDRLEARDVCLVSHALAARATRAHARGGSRAPLRRATVRSKSHAGAKSEALPSVAPAVVAGDRVAARESGEWAERVEPPRDRAQRAHCDAPSRASTPSAGDRARPARRDRGAAAPGARAPRAARSASRPPRARLGQHRHRGFGRGRRRRRRDDRRRDRTA